MTFMKPDTSTIFSSWRDPSRFRFYVTVVLFVFFLMPISFSVRGDNVSGNYSFVLFPLITLIFGQKLQIPSKSILAIIAVYIFIFIFCSFYQLELLKFWDRRLISFTLFISFFTFFFIKIDEQICKAFKYAVILASVIYSFNSIISYLYYQALSIGPDKMRALIESQRYGFILLFGFWLLLFEKVKTTGGLVLKTIGIFAVFNGLGLTYSRSSVAGLLVSSGSLFLVIILISNFNQIKKWPYRNIAPLLFYFSIAALIITISYNLFPEYFQYYSSRLLKVSITPPHIPVFFPYANFPAYDTVFWHFYDTSEGYRIFMIKEIFKYLSLNPLFGSGFLGVWIMYENLHAAAHNQLLDVLFRTGLIGFSAFLYLLYKIIKYNFTNRNWAVFISLIGILVIGVFHETFKLSQGAFVFAFLASQAFNYIEVKPKNILNFSGN